MGILIGEAYRGNHYHFLLFISPKKVENISAA